MSGLEKSFTGKRHLSSQIKPTDLSFMDEPFSELDSFTAQELRKQLISLWQKRNLTIVMVTHLIEEAIELGNQIAVLTPRPGKIEKIIPNNLPRPLN